MPLAFKPQARITNPTVILNLFQLSVGLLPMR